jgi:hypothetical protein
MSEATETLDAVTRLVQAVKTNEASDLAKILQPAIDYFIESDKEQRARSAAQTHAPPPNELNLWDLERYVNVCEKLKLDPKDPGTRQVLLNLGKGSA